MQYDSLAQVPAVATAWKMPKRGSPDQAPMAVLGTMLAEGDASIFYQGLVKGREIALNLEVLFGLTSPWEYDGPTILTVFGLYKPNSSADAMLAAMDEEIAKIVKDGVSPAALQRVQTRMLADWYDNLESFINRADTLAKLQTLWGDANVINKVPQWIAAVTPADVQRVAGLYLTKANRSTIDRQLAPKVAPAAASASAASAPASTKP